MAPDDPFTFTEQLDDSLFRRPVQGFYPFCRNDEALKLSVASRTKYIDLDRERSVLPQLRLTGYTGLPALLTSKLEVAPPNLNVEEEVRHIATEWLFRPTQTEILFGAADPGVLSEQLRFTRASNFVTPKEEDTDTNTDRPFQSSHLYYQQFWQGWPVVGGVVSVNLTLNNERVVVTNSFFPIPTAKLFEPPANPGESRTKAVEQARKALAADTWVQQRYREFTIDKWVVGEEIFIVPYEGSELTILPFDGDYYLGYLIELISPDQDYGWRVFVDSESNRVLGAPHLLVAHAHPQYFKSAVNVLANPPQSDPYGDDLATLSTNVEKFAKFRLHNSAGSGSLQQMDTFAQATAPALELELTNIAVHAYELYKHFVNPAAGCVDENTLCGYTNAGGMLTKPGLCIVVGKDGAAVEMGFNFASSLLQKLIVFQTDKNGVGLGWDSDGDGNSDKKVFTPSFDPEVIYHELTHAFLWLINKSPFEPPQGSAPFALAIAEGYANYFAHSFAEKQGVSTDKRWASAAYRASQQEGGQEVGWGDDWALERAVSKAREDFLPLPDIYPNGNQAPTRQDISTYYIGMVWARALWDVRKILGGDLTDRIALRAYAHLVGWLSTYEIAALGFLNSANDEAAAKPHLNTIAAIFNRRRILSQQDAQALLTVSGASSSFVLLGVDQGMRVSSSPAGNWSQPSTPGTGGLSGITAFTTDANVTVYAATEQGIYTVATSNLSNPAWQPVGNWPSPPGHIRCLHRTNDGLLVAGTHDGLYKLNSTLNQWEKHGTASFKILGLASFGTGLEQKIFAAGIGSTWAIYYSEVNQPAATWSTLSVSANALELPFCLQVVDDYLYIGTSRGIQWRKLDFATAQVTSGAQTLPTDAMILCLYLDKTTNTLYAGTTHGLYAAKRTNEQINGWDEINLGAPANSPLIVTAISTTPTEIVAGTAAAGLFVGAKSGAPLAAVNGLFV